MNIKGNEVRK